MVQYWDEAWNVLKRISKATRTNHGGHHWTEVWRDGWDQGPDEEDWLIRYRGYCWEATRAEWSENKNGSTQGIKD